MSRPSRLREDFDELARIGRDPGGGWSRPAYGVAEQAAHLWFAERAEAAGLTVRADAAGNLIARREGTIGLPAIALGSHLDTVTRGGAFDGTIGVLAGLEVLRRLDEAERHGVPLEVIAFRDEEGRFGAFTGSRAMIGTLPAEEVARMRDAEGVALAAAMREAGLDPDAIGEARRDPAELAAFLELHIEQGQVLERARCGLGVIEAIAGQERLAVRFTGAPDHSGTTPMDQRRDAFAAAARFADRFRDTVLAHGGGTARGTVGIVRVSPGQGNVVPGEVRLGLEIRDSDSARLADLAARTETLAAEAAEALRVEHRCRSVYGAPPVPLSPAVRAALLDAAERTGHQAMPLLSGANHDAGVLAARVPAGMLFVPSRGGRSHCPEEHTDWPHVERAVEVLEATVQTLAAAVAAGQAPEQAAGAG